MAFTKHIKLTRCDAVIFVASHVRLRHSTFRNIMRLIQSINLKPSSYTVGLSPAALTHSFLSISNIFLVLYGIGFQLEMS